MLVMIIFNFISLSNSVYCKSETTLMNLTVHMHFTYFNLSYSFDKVPQILLLHTLNKLNNFIIIRGVAPEGIFLPICNASSCAEQFFPFLGIMISSQLLIRISYSLLIFSCMQYYRATQKLTDGYLYGTSVTFKNYMKLLHSEKKIISSARHKIIPFFNFLNHIV
jgi:hypothetical protein